MIRGYDNNTRVILRVIENPLFFFFIKLLDFPKLLNFPKLLDFRKLLDFPKTFRLSKNF